LRNGNHDKIDVANGYVNRVPYRSGADAVPDMLGGRVQMNFGTIENLAPLVQEGKLRALAVTGETRSYTLPDVPTLKEAGFPQLTRGFWAGLLAPAGNTSAARPYCLQRD
jgi:tripartite-type tricarboxylate transporter receptor subunit TctC